MMLLDTSKIVREIQIEHQNLSQKLCTDRKILQSEMDLVRNGFGETIADPSACDKFYQF